MKKPAVQKVYGENVQDARDSKSYKTVVIGSQTWLAENLNFQSAESWCYENKPENCHKFGRLYTWNAALQACPAGFHLPTRDELVSLAKNVGGTKDSAGSIWDNVSLALKSTSDWMEETRPSLLPGVTKDLVWGNGNDTYGFNVLPAGSYDSLTNEFSDLGAYAAFWSASDTTETQAFGLDIWQADQTHIYEFKKTSVLSVRCLKNP